MPNVAVWATHDVNADVHGPNQPLHPYPQKLKPEPVSREIRKLAPETRNRLPSLILKVEGFVKPRIDGFAPRTPIVDPSI